MGSVGRSSKEWRFLAYPDHGILARRNNSWDRQFRKGLLVRILGLMLLGLLSQGASAAAEDKVPSAAEAARRRVAALLTPGAGVDGVVGAREPVARLLPRQVADPQTPIPPVKGLPPPLTVGSLRIVPPRDVPEPAPLVKFRADPVRPAALELPAGFLVRLPSPDVEQPLSLPILARQQRDRALLRIRHWKPALLPPSRHSPLPEQAPSPFSH